MNVGQIKKLDEESYKKLKDKPGPADTCLCGLLAPPHDNSKKNIKTSIKKVFASITGLKKKPKYMTGRKTVDIPLSVTKKEKGIYSTKEVVTRKSACGKCGCDSNRVVLKHSFANIRITSPDLSSVCPCPTDCLPDKARLVDNIKVTIERMSVPTWIPSPPSTVCAKSTN